MAFTSEDHQRIISAAVENVVPIDDVIIEFNESHQWYDITIVTNELPDIEKNGEWDVRTVGHKSYLYRGRLGGFMQQYMALTENRKGYGGAHIPINFKGGTKVLEGPWSSRPSCVNRAFDEVWLSCVIKTPDGSFRRSISKDLLETILFVRGWETKYEIVKVVDNRFDATYDLKEIGATEKSSEIDNLLSSITGKNRSEVIANGLCMTCDGKADEFKDELSTREYRISGMCQACQDEIFAPPEEDSADC